ncbi:hypothetical protein GINT2_002134 [Glugoides intestinalis]
MSKRLEILLKTSPSILSEANCVVLEDQYGSQQIVKVKKIFVKNSLVLFRYIKDHCCTILDTCYGRFIYDYKLDKFVSPCYIWNGKKSFDDIYQTYMLKNRDEESLENYEKRIIFGDNDLGVKIPSLFKLIANRVFHPLFIWEIISLVIWVSVNYIDYATVVGIIFFTMFIVELIRDIQNRRMLLKSLKISTVRVLREGSFRQIPEHDLLPGDIVYIDTTDNFSCDVEILKGNVITDEGFLTGEAVPICKGVGSLVYSGTKIIKSNSTSVSLNNPRMEKLVRVKNLTRHQESQFTAPIARFDSIDDVSIGIVLKTGKKTKRGLLFKNLAVKRPSNNAFSTQSLKVIKYLTFLSLTFLTSFTFYLKYRQIPFAKVMKYSFDIALTFFSPALYTSLELGAQHARGQLLKKKINTTDVSRINTAGEVDMIVFDKTGTLTELGVDILCFDTIKKSIESIEEIDNISRMALSTCHYVLELDNQYSGDILDMKMFMFSQSKIINKDTKRFIEMEVMNKYQPICKEYTGKEDDCTLFFDTENNSSTSNTDIYPEDTLEVLKIYDFDLYLKRISVVVKTHENKMYLFCKGAPDSVSKILKNVPENYAEKVRDYGLEGYRVLTVGYKEIAEYGNREADEAGLEFLGFLVFANKLKKETEEVIKELREAELNPKMCTGDNILTAISVARECGMIDNTMPVLFPVLEEGCKSIYDVEWFCVADEDYVFDKWKMQLYYEINRSAASEFVVAIEGKEFEYFKYSNYNSFILEKGVVFARFNPDNKKELIEEYSKNGHVTMFCGDGANDTGALCSADVGVSLATNEASLAASFNSRNLSSVLDVIKEGRSALSMSAAQFKYIFYSQVLAGFQMLALLPQLLFPADRMSLVNDLMSCYLLAYALSNFKAAKRIHMKKISIDLGLDAFYLFIELLATLGVFLIVSFSMGCSTLLNTPPTVILASKNSAVLFICTMVLLVYRSLKFADFGPHRQKLHTNSLFIGIFIFCSLVTAFISLLLLSGNQKVLNCFSAIKLETSDVVKCVFSIIFLFLIIFLFDFIDRQRINGS